MTAVDTTRIRTLMSQKNLDVTRLAMEAGISRQAVHRFLRAGYDPFPSGFTAVASALGVSAEALLSREKAHVLEDETMALLGRASQGEARAFEVLPASVAKLPARALSSMHPDSDDEIRLLAAAGEICAHLSGSRRLKRFVERMAAGYNPGRAFFFGHRMMDAERIVSDTPPQTKKHNVFGSFKMEDFARHFG